MNAKNPPLTDTHEGSCDNKPKGLMTSLFMGVEMFLWTFRPNLNKRKPEKKEKAAG